MKVKENLEHILKELQDATFKIEEEQIENVLKLIAPDKKIFNWKRKIRVGGEGFCKQIDASWISGVCHWRNFNTTYESWRSIDHNIWVRRNRCLGQYCKKSQRIWTISWTCYNESAIHTGENGRWDDHTSR